MKSVTAQKSAAYADVARIIGGRPASSLSMLPAFWQGLADGAMGTGLSEAVRADYIEAAQRFVYHKTPLGIEALEVIGQDFMLENYPDFSAWRAEAKTALAQKTLAAVEEIFATLGHDVPAALYDLFLETAFRDNADVLLGMFRQKDQLMRDRLWDAALHAALLVTPVGMFIQSVFSRHGLRFMHVMDCGCRLFETPEASFDIALDADLKPAYLQNMLAATFEQYGVNAATSRAGRGF